MSPQQQRHYYEEADPDRALAMLVRNPLLSVALFAAGGTLTAASLVSCRPAGLVKASPDMPARAHARVLGLTSLSHRARVGQGLNIVSWILMKYDEPFGY